MSQPGSSSGSSSSLKDILLGFTLGVLLSIGVSAFLNANQQHNGSDHTGAQQAAMQGNQAIAAGQPQQPAPPPLLANGTEAPAFSLQSTEGKTVALKDFAGKKYVLLELFATWCPHCQHAVPGLNQFAQKHASQLEVLGVNAGDRPGEPSTAEAFKTQFKANYTILDKPNPELVQAYHLFAFPTVYLIDKAGKVAWSQTGGLTPDAEKQLAKLIK